KTDRASTLVDSWQARHQPAQRSLYRNNSKKKSATTHLPLSLNPSPKANKSTKAHVPFGGSLGKMKPRKGSEPAPVVGVYQRGLLAKRGTEREGQGGFSGQL
ncbi:hypothetical protein KIPB_014105, partial [Kipferlia bialata]